MTEGTCSVAECVEPAYCRGWCSMHYKRWSRNGTVELLYPSICTECGVTLPPAKFGRPRMYCAGCKDSSSVRKRYDERYWASLTAEERAASRRHRHLWAHYRMRLDEYNAILEAQGGVCAICRKAPESGPLTVDHDHSCCPGAHSCGRCNRGLLCQPCNRAMGHFRDSADVMRAAVAYVDQWSETVAARPVQPQRSVYARMDDA